MNETEFSFKDRLLAAPRPGAFIMEGYFVWCGSVIRGEDGRYHMFASRWPKTVSFLHWATHSEIIRASADTPAGPFRFEEVVLAPRGPEWWDGRVTHNPTIHYSSGKYLLFYTGTTFDGPASEHTRQLEAVDDVWVRAWNGKRIGMAVADSVFGPWTRPDKPILQVNENGWDAAITSNPAVCVREDGSIILIYKSCRSKHPLGVYKDRFHLGVTRAAGWKEPFVRLSDAPIRLAGHDDPHIEDPYIWWNGRRFEMIVKDMTGEICGETAASIHAFSDDAIHWTIAKRPLAYSRALLWDDGSVEQMVKLERPQLLIVDNCPRHLYSATMRKDPNGIVTDSWSVGIPLKYPVG